MNPGVLWDASGKFTFLGGVICLYGIWGCEREKIPTGRLIKVLFLLYGGRWWRFGWVKKFDVTIDCVAGSNCSGVLTRVGCLRAIGHPRVSTRVTRTHSGNSLSRGTRCSTTGRTRNVVRTGLSRLGNLVSGTHLVSRAHIRASRIRVLGGIGVGGAGGGTIVACALISSSRTGLGRNGVTIDAPVTRKLVKGGINSVIRVGIPSNVVDFRVVSVSVWWCGVVTSVFDEVITNRVPYRGITRGRRFFTFLSVGPITINRALIVPGGRVSCVFSVRSPVLKHVVTFTGQITHTRRTIVPYGQMNLTIVKLRIPRTRVRLVPVRGRSSVCFNKGGVRIARSILTSATTQVEGTFGWVEWDLF